MKKVLLFCAALVVALNASADITYMTCAEAKAYTLDNLQSGESSTDSVAITGYVTNTNGSISRGQQTFWLDDVKGTTKTFQAYWCNMPLGNDDTPLEVGDKVIIKGYLLNYGGTTAEMKNGDVVILERKIVERETIEVGVCEAIEEGEALASGDLTEDYFQVKGVISSVDRTDSTNFQQTVWMTCSDNSKRFEGYYMTLTDKQFVDVKDTVLMLGRITNFNGTIEIANGKMWTIGRAQREEIKTIEATVEEALAVGQALADNETTRDTYVVRGYVDSIAAAYDSQYMNISFFLTTDMNNPTYDLEVYRCKADGDIELGSEVIVTGKIKKYVTTKNEETTTLIEIVNGTFEYVTSDALYDVTTDQTTVKTLENGRLIIRRNNRRYNAVGVEL